MACPTHIFRQGSLVLRHSPPELSEAFCASRLSGTPRGDYGTLPATVDCHAIIARATPKLTPKAQL